MPRALVLIDQLTRDAFSQLLVIERLKAAGVEVTAGNQGTFVAACERTRPDVVFASLQASGALMDYLRVVSKRARVVLIDQEGNKPGEETFKRAYTASRRMEYMRFATRVFSWGEVQARWLKELDVPAEKIVVTGNPRLDPYLAPELAERRPEKRVGMTFRFDLFTADPFTVMQTIYVYALGRGTRVGYPPWASIEDHLWHKVAVARHMLMALDRLNAADATPLVVRPGPWESPEVYEFLRKIYPRVSFEPHALQHDYIMNSSAILDDCSTLGIEALAVGVPVVSIQKAIPRLEDHIGGPGKGLYDAPYLRYYWQPQTIDEAVALVQRAHRGELPQCPEPGVREYLKGIYDWPRSRPAAFDMADSILEVLGLPPPEGDAGTDEPVEMASPRMIRFYRNIPGSSHLKTLKMFLDCVRRESRNHLLRYHYFGPIYPHHARVRGLYRTLADKYR